MNKIILCVGLFCMISSYIIFGYSFHNVDLAVNMAYGAIDINGWAYQQDKVAMYLNGLNGLQISEILNAVGILLLIYSDKK